MLFFSIIIHIYPREREKKVRKLEFMSSKHSNENLLYANLVVIVRFSFYPYIIRIVNPVACIRQFRGREKKPHTHTHARVRKPSRHSIESASDKLLVTQSKWTLTTFFLASDLTCTMFEKSLGCSNAHGGWLWMRWLCMKIGKWHSSICIVSLSAKRQPIWLISYNVLHICGTKLLLNIYSFCE